MERVERVERVRVEDAVAALTVEGWAACGGVAGGAADAADRPCCDAADRPCCNALSPVQHGQTHENGEIGNDRGTARVVF